jgi:sulfite exporter TauE/SafE
MLFHDATLAERWLAICSADGLDGSLGGLSGALALVGLIGGALHCAPMCGPFVLAQSVGTRKGGPGARLSEVALLPYHLGRLTTYAALGALSGALGGATVALPMVVDRTEASATLAVLTSLKAVGRNWWPMMLWAGLIVVFSLAGLVLIYVGLIVTLPVIGHASYHACRDLVVPEDDAPAA